MKEEWLGTNLQELHALIFLDLACVAACVLQGQHVVLPAAADFHLCQPLLP